MKKIFYWSPITSNIATKKAVINSAKSLVKYSSNYQVTLINVAGEFNESDLSESNIDTHNLSDEILKKKFIGKGFIKTRVEMIYIFIKAFFPLINLIKDQKPDFIIVHLLTSLPLIIFLLFNFKTKLVLRVSGLPKMNIIRYLLWKICTKKVYMITCPTLLACEYLKKFNFLDNNKIITLFDPIINVLDINKKKREKNEFLNKKYYLAAGRLTVQKNFEFLIKAFDKIIRNSDKLLLIAGEGEEKDKLEKLIHKNNLDKKILLIGHKKNIYKYMKNCEAFILPSLWEDPGFVLIEAAYCRANIISSDCKNGPIEFLENNKCGFMFKSNSRLDFEKQYNFFINSDSISINQKKLNAFKKTKNFTSFVHYKKLNKILS